MLATRCRITSLDGLLVVAALLSASACGDPVRDERADSLPGEVRGVPKGPFHRAGQPCADCHADGGEAVPFSIAGTIYQYRDFELPLRDAVVRFIDSGGASFVTATNCTGNFYVFPGDYSPKYPMRVSVTFGGYEAEMLSFVHREGSCARCHSGSASTQSAGRVYLLPEPGGILKYDFPPVGCP